MYWTCPVDENYLRTLLTKVINFWLRVATYNSSAPLPEPKKEEVSVSANNNQELQELIAQKQEIESKLKEIQQKIDDKFIEIQKEMNEKNISKMDLGFGTYSKTEAKGNFDYKAFLAKKGVLITPEDENQFRKKSSIRWSFKAA